MTAGHSALVLNCYKAQAKINRKNGNFTPPLCKTGTPGNTISNLCKRDYRWEITAQTNSG